MPNAPTPHTDIHASSPEDWLPRVCRLTGAAGAGIWKVSDDDIRCEHQFSLGEQSLDAVHQSWQGHTELLRRVAASGGHEVAQATFQYQNESKTLTLLLLNQKNAIVLELFYARTLPLAPEVIAELVQSLLGSTSEPTLTGTSLDLVIRILSRTSPGEAAIGLVNDLRVWSGADRVSLIKLSAHPAVASISGLASLDPRSPVVQELSHLSEQHRTQLVASPCLVEQQRWFWHLPQSGHILIFESLGESSLNSPPEAELSCMRAVAQQCLNQSEVLQTARKHPLLKWLNPLWSSTGFFWNMAALLIAGAVVAMSIIQVDLTLYVPGRLEPQISRMVFTPSPAVVDTIHVAAGQEVTVDEPLLDLRSDALDLEAQRLTGEQRTVEQQLADLETLRNDPARDRDPAVTRNIAELTTRAEELSIVSASLAAQLEVVQKQRAALQLRSPVAGTVLTWDIDQLLRGRPVTTDQILLKIADFKGPWKLELVIPQDDLAAFTRQPVKEVSFVTSGSDERYTANIAEQSPELRVDPDHGMVLPVTATLTEVPDAQSGTYVVVRVDCGQAPVGYVWFRHAIDQVVRWWNLRW